MDKNNNVIDESLFINEELDDSESDSGSDSGSDSDSDSGSDSDSENDSDSESDDDSDLVNDEYFSDDNMVYKVNHLENADWIKGYNSDGDIYETPHENV